MIRTYRCFAALALAAALSACASAPKEENAINIVVGPDGKMTMVVPKNASADDLAMAAIMNAALAGELGEKTPALPEDQVWRAEPDNHLVHIQSGAQCPATWAGLPRESKRIYEPDGTNVGCNYSDGGNTFTTIYYYHGNPNIEAELEDAFKAMKERQPVSKETSFADKSSAYRARTLAYKLANGTAMRTSVLVAQSGGWTLKLRITCPEAAASLVERNASIGLIGQSDRLTSPPLTPVPADTRSAAPKPL